MTFIPDRAHASLVLAENPGRKPVPDSSAAPKRPAPAGPFGLPLFGSALRWKRDPAAFVADLHRRYGDLVPFRMGPYRLFLVARPDWIKDILVTRQHEFVKGRGLEWAKEFLGEGLLTAEAPHHTRQRRLAQPAFHRQRIGAYGEVMVARAERFTSRLEDGSRIDLAKELMALTLGIAGKTLFDAEVEDDAAGIGEALRELMEGFLDFASPLTPLTRRLPLARNRRIERAKAAIDSIIFRMIEERRQDPRDRGDFLSMLMAARDEEDGSRMTDAQLRDECVTTFLAGHETTATALSWTFLALARHPEVRARMVAEIETVLGGRLARASDLKDLPYTEAVMTEAMRLYPPAWAIARRNKSTYVIDGVEIPPMTGLVLSPFVVQRDPRYYETPLEFRPERWTPEFRAGLPPFAYFPFGGGARRCIGEAFAWMEGVLLLATIVPRLEFELEPQARVEPRALVTLRPAPGLPMTVRRIERIGPAGPC